MACAGCAARRKWIMDRVAFMRERVAELRRRAAQQPEKPRE